MGMIKKDKKMKGRLILNNPVVLFNFAGTIIPKGGNDHENL